MPRPIKNMEVILKQDVERIGRAGSVIKVKDGFARNFLLPNKLAVIATSSSLKKLEEEKQRKIQQLEKTKKEAESMKNKLQSLSLTVPVLVQDDERLYGSITAIEIANALKEEGFDIEKSLIMLDEPIKSLGVYEIQIRLHPEVIAKVKIWVVKK